MKILHLISTNGIAGAEKHLNYLLPGMAAYDYECHLIIVHPKLSTPSLTLFADLLNAKNVKTTLIRTEHSISLSVLRKIEAYLKLHKIKIIHSHLLRADVLAVILKKVFCKQLYVISTKHGYEEKVVMNYNADKFEILRNIYYYLTKYCLKNIDQNISISRCISQLFINFNLTKTYYKVIYHGVDVEFEKMPLLDFDNSNPKLVIVGRLEPLKGHKYVIKAMEIVLKHVPNAQLYIIGDGSYKENLKEITEKCNIAENVKFLGFKSNVLAFMKEADLIIIPSSFEAFGLVFIEAMGLKKCILAFDVPAGNEILTHKKTAMLSPVFDENLLAENILFLLSNKVESNRIAENAFLAYNENFTTEIMIRNTANFYKSVSF